MHDLKRKIHLQKKKFRSKQSNMSFNLEEYMHEKQKIARRAAIAGIHYHTGGALKGD